MPRYIDISEGKLPVRWRRINAKTVKGQPCEGVVRYEDLQSMPIVELYTPEQLDCWKQYLLHLKEKDL